jgi:hypothetical protein
MGRKNEMTKAPGLRIVSYDLKSKVRRGNLNLRAKELVAVLLL